MVLCPAASACCAATHGQITISPSTPSITVRPSPGRSSSMGKLITSVGPSRFIQRMCSWAMGSGSTNMMVRSDCVLTRIWSITHMPRSENTLPSICQTVSLVTSTLIQRSFRFARLFAWMWFCPWRVCCGRRQWPRAGRTLRRFCRQARVALRLPV